MSNYFNYSAGGNLVDHMRDLHDMVYPRKASVVPIADLLEYLHIFKRMGCTVTRLGKLSIFEIGGHPTIKAIYADQTGAIPKGSSFLIDLNQIDRQMSRPIKR